MGEETFRIEIPINVEDKTNPGVSSATQKVNAFDKANQKMQDRLNQINRSKYQVILSAMDKASGIIGTVSSKARSLAGKTFKFTMKVFDVATSPLRGILKLATSVEGALFGAAGAWAAFYKPMEQAGNFEQTKMAFSTMLKSSKEANKFLNKARTFANKTPFEFNDVTNSSKLLLSFGFQEKDILKMLTTIGDTSSGLGTGADGIERITRALGQMKAKGRVQAEELLQLQELGIPVTEILTKKLGLTAAQVGNIGKQGVSADKAIKALLEGMNQRYGNMMMNMSKTDLGMLSTLHDTLTNNFIRPWGEGLWKGFKPGLKKITDWLDKNQDTVNEWARKLKDLGSDISTTAMSKIDDLKSSIAKMVNSREWKEAKSPLQKVKIAWNTIIADPFYKWWSAKGKAFTAKASEEIGQGFGSALKIGILGLLGMDISKATKDGTNIGEAFATGFTKGFDGDKVKKAVTKAIKGVFKDAAKILPGGDKASGTSWLSTAAIMVVLKKLGLFKLLGKGAKGIGGLLKKTGKDIGDLATNTMVVNAGVVYVNGATAGGNGSGTGAGTGEPVGGGSGGAGAFLTGAGGGGAGALLTGAGTGALLTGLGGVGARALLSGSKLGSDALLTGSTASTIGGSLLTGPAAGATLSSVLLKNGTYAATSGLATPLANLGVMLGSGATTAGGAAAVGGLSLVSIIGAVLGLGSAGIDLYKGIKAKKTGNREEGTKKFYHAGTKIGMVGTGAAIGALAGGPLGAVLGAGIGGASSLVGGNKLGDVIQKSAETGWISKARKGAGKFFEHTLPGAFNIFCNGIGSFFKGSTAKSRSKLNSKTNSLLTKTIPTVWGNGLNAQSSAFKYSTIRLSGKMIKKSDSLFIKNSSSWGNGLNKAGASFKNSSNRMSSKMSKKVGSIFIKNSSAWNNGMNRTGASFKNSSSKLSGKMIRKTGTLMNGSIPNAWDSFCGTLGSFFTNTLPKVTSDLLSKARGIFNFGHMPASKGSKVKKHAYGGIMTQPHMGIVAEAGPESIIPLSASKRSRGYDLWKQTGQMLGVRPYADGGIVGDDKDTTPVPVNMPGKGNIKVTVNVKASPKFSISGGNKTDKKEILAIVKGNIREMTDDIGDELAIKLEKIFSNMPKTQGV
jgi:tape measure domain-containing protein